MVDVPPAPPLSHLNALNEEQLRELASSLIAQIARKDQDILYRQAKIDQLTHELAVLKRWKFGKSREHLDPAQASLLDEAIDGDIAAIEVELEQLAPAGAKPSTAPRTQPKRMPLPANLPRREVGHEPDSTTCQTPGCGCEMKRIGEDVAERLDYTPGVFTVERHVRGKWACLHCQTLTQAPVPAQVIDKGVPTSGLLAQVLVAKYADHLPLYRQEAIFARAGVAIARSTLGQWVGECGVALQPLVDALKAHILRSSVLHADESPVQMLRPARQDGDKSSSKGRGQGHTQRAYCWAYSPPVFEDTKAVVYDFCDGRAGANARRFLGQWQGTLVTDDFAGYKQLYTQGITEAGCWAHARRKFFDLHASSQSPMAAQALAYIGQLYEVEREAREQDATAQQRGLLRQAKSKPLLDAMHAWMLLMRHKVMDNSAAAKALDYSLRRWAALSRFLDDPQLPIDNNHIENLIRPIALGRKNWLFAGSLRAGQRAAAIMSLIQSARMNGHDPYVYLKDVLTRLPTHKNSQIDDLLPHLWRPACAPPTDTPVSNQP
jgi:transposase